MICTASGAEKAIIFISNAHDPVRAKGTLRRKAERISAARQSEGHIALESRAGSADGY